MTSTKIYIIYQILDLNKVIMIWTKITRYIIKSTIFFASDTTETRHTLHTKRFELKNV